MTSIELDPVVELDLLPPIRSVHFGPVWESNPNWDGVSLTGLRGRYILPEISLGPQVIAWVHDNLLSPDSNEFHREPFLLTYEQWRFIMWWYAIDERGRWIYRRGVLQRAKGWGKDPVAAVISAIELLGPCRFVGWCADPNGMPDLGLNPDGTPAVKYADPVGGENPNAWVQIAAVSKTQTQNTMLLFPGLLSEEAKARAYMRADSIGITKVTAYRGRRQIQAVTSNPSALEGGRPSFVIKNEALALDTPIPTPTGWTTMGALQEGDTIFGSDGRPTRVTQVLPVQFDRHCFRVTFADGTSIVASDGHLWQTRVVGSSAKPKIRATLEMFEDGRRFAVPRAGAREHDRVELPVDPYLLGAWLGDGSSGQANLTVGDEDLDDLRGQLARRGVETHLVKSGLGRAHTVSFSQRRGFGAEMGSDVAKALRGLPCWKNKHIPVEYLQASVEQRLELLRGLMDTDGCISAPQGQCIFVGREKLATGVLELLRGLGQVATSRFVIDKRSRDGGYWKITFTPRGIQPFALPRKAARVRGIECDWVSIKCIEEVPSVPVRCIAVEAEDRLFQAGEGGHVTHNTEHWTEANRGWEMDQVIDRNAAKSKGGASRVLAICNAPEPSEESVGRRERDAYMAELEGRAFKTGVMYDSLELPEETPLYPENIGHLEPDEQEELVMEHLRRCLTTVRGDSWWLDWERIALEILDTKVSTSTARRFYLNQAIASEDSWVDPKGVNAAIDPVAAVLRTESADQTRCTWDVVRPDEPIVMFFDGSKSDDATALIGCRLSDGYCFTIGIWQAPPQSRKRGKQTWLAPRGEIDSRVDEAFERFTVVAFWADPSHAKATTETGELDGGYWQGLIDDWHKRYKNVLFEEHWSVKTGATQHSILWDMASPLHQKLFVHAAEQTVDELEHTLPDGTLAPKFSHDGHPRLMEHLKNAKKAPGQFGVSLRKESRESLRKIDGAVALVGARLLRRMVLNAEIEEEKQGGWAWGL